MVEKAMQATKNVGVAKATPENNLSDPGHEVKIQWKIQYTFIDKMKQG